ncbi:ATP-binding protein [Mesorhizobium neociceri]|uniref:ATP-binding protein n=1 Tax=Mesorhizobium neociceri TaxID=1307853 RepID=A0A838B6D7_9HYPH|nr:DUF87 domain-containing protein [Mesorhizobium neociceri]MBA1141713.1 ATP-binding protein [Mesorhizobium neociceri]
MSIPAAALERHIGILGKTGSGKSNAAKTIAERIMFEGGRVCVIDPTGTWWGIRLRPDGAKKSRFEPVIFGGNHADIPIAGEHGAAVGEAIATASSSAIIDTRLMTVGARTRFFTAFAEALLRTNSGTLHLIIDEAHLFAPQGRVNDPQSGAMVGAANNLVSLGRGIGLRIILISQRPAKLHKDSLTQVETLVAMRLIAPQDRKAIEDWIGEWADPGKGKEVTASLPSLATGSAWVWSPEIDLLEKVKFPLAATFDSGKPSAQQQALDPIDVKSMGDRLDTIRQEVLANDPARLRREIAALQAKLAVAPKAGVDPKAIEQADARGYERGKMDGTKEGMILASQRAAEYVSAALKHIQETPARSFLSLQEATPQAMPVIVQPATRPRPVNQIPEKPVSGQLASGSIELGAERKPLALLAAAYPAGYTEAQWASLAGFKRTGGTWSTYKSRLRTKGAVEQRGDLWFATEDGVDALGGDIPAMPRTPEERLAMWKSKVAGIGPMLDALRNRYPDQTGRADLAFQLGLAPGGGTFGTYLSRARSNGLIDEPERGFYRISSAIMGDI